MASEQSESGSVYEVYCRECEWQADGPIDLKGTANLLAGRHISQTGHVVALKTIESDRSTADDFHRGGRSVSVEVLRQATGGRTELTVRRCGSIECTVEPT